VNVLAESPEIHRAAACERFSDVQITGLDRVGPKYKPVQQAGFAGTISTIDKRQRSNWQSLRFCKRLEVPNM
jgi:hypothetical protein